MRRLGSISALVLGAATVALACGEDGQSLPERCTDPALQVFDSRHTPPPADDNRMYPCLTPVGHAVLGSPTGGSSSAPSAAGAAGDASAGAGGG